MAEQISDSRKAAYYIGLGLMLVGGILFISTFVTFGSNINNTVGSVSTFQSSFLRAVFGMVFIVVGFFVKTIGARGLAGSGVVLDTEKARQDLEPYSRMAGGMVKDAMDEAKINLDAKPEKVIMLKCRSCGKLNNEDSKFCQECGKAI